MSTDPALPKADPLTELLDVLPVGISAAVAGVSFFQNRRGRAHAELPADRDTVLGDRKIRVETLALNLMGAACEVRLSRDVTDIVERALDAG